MMRLMREREARPMLRFYRECLARAFRGRFGQVEKWTAAISLLGLALIASRSSLSADTQRLLQVEIPVYFFIATFLVTVLAGLIISPYRLFAEEKEKCLALESLRTPRLQIQLPGPDPIGVALDGSTTETYGGMRQTMVTKWASAVFYLLCTNTGETEAKRCRARVLCASRDADDFVEAGGIVESIELAWSKTDPDNHLSADIAPGDTVRIWVAYVRQNGSLWVFRNDLPVHYQRVFGVAGHHKILLQVDSENAATTQVLMSIQTDEAKKPAGNGVWEPTAKAAILAQGRPVLQHPDMPKRTGDVLAP
jgi:hypothetical protein